MKPVNRSQTAVFSTASSQGNASQSEASQGEVSQGKVSVPPTSELSSQDASVFSLKTCHSIVPSRFNRIAQVLFKVVAIAMGMALVSGVTYLIAVQLDVLQRSRQPVFEPKQPRLNKGEQTISNVENLSRSQSSLAADASAKIQFDRARELAASDSFEAAIAEASKIPFGNLLYQQAQQSINQWSEQILQKEAEQRAMQQTLQAEHENNQRHLQLAQQALAQNDWTTALQEARQISNDSLWQQQKDYVIQKAEPSEHEQQAKQFLAQGEPENAIDEANKLPPIAPWMEKRSIIIEQANQKIAEKKIVKKWNDRCRGWAKDNISRCPNVEDVKTFEEILPTNWLSRFIPSSHKPKR